MEGKHYHNRTVAEKIRLRFDWNFSGKLLVYCVVAGFLAGLLAVLVYTGFQFVGSSISGLYLAAGVEFPTPIEYTAVSGHPPGTAFIDAPRKDIYFDGRVILPHYWILILLIPSFGGLLCGFLTWSFAPEATGEGADCVIRTFHFRNGILRNRIPLVKIIASFLTLGTGGSAGWEGPTTLFGAGIASSLSQYLRLNVRDRRILLLAGAAGGIGAIFQIPIGGALYAVEILYASTALEFAAVIPCLIASSVGYSVFHFFHGNTRPLAIPSTVGIHHATDFIVFLAFIPIIAFCGLVFVRVVMEFRNRFFRRLPIPDFFKPALGGFLLGCIALLYPQVFGGGYEWMYRLLEGKLPFYLILCLIIPKMLATALTVSSGGSGGLLAPSLFIGGLVGGALGHLCLLLFHFLGIPELAPDITSCVLIGMATFFAGVGKLPFAAAVIVCEIVGFDYALLIPLISLNLVHIAIQSPSTSLYEEQVLSPIDSEAHFGNYSVDLLRVISVQETCLTEEKKRSILTIPANATVPQTAKLISSKPDSLFPVVDAENHLIGVVHSSDVWAFFRSRKKWGLTAEDISQSADMVVFPNDDLYRALQICTLWQVAELPVVDEDHPDVLLGILRHHEIINAYNERLAVAQWT